MALAARTIPAGGRFETQLTFRRVSEKFNHTASPTVRFTFRVKFAGTAAATTASVHQRAGKPPAPTGIRR